MEYFFSHIGYILIAGVLIGILAFAAIFFAEKSAKISAEREEERSKADDIACGFNCSSCVRAETCTKEGKKR